MNYQILHDNGHQYGPVPAETLRQWIREGRVNVQTRTRPDGAADWTPLGEISEFTADVGTAPTPAASGPGPGKTSRLAIASLVLGVLGLFTCGATAVIGLVLGIVGLVKISRSRGALSGNGLAVGGIVTSALFVLFIPVYAALLLPALANARQKAQSISCINNLRQIELSSLQYAAANGGTFPGTNWSDVVVGRMTNPAVLECPAAEPGGCGYALNARLIGRATQEVNPKTVLYFESDAGRNATGGMELMIREPRHVRVFVVGLADGSVRQLSASQLPGLRWEP